MIGRRFFFGLLFTLLFILASVTGDRIYLFFLYVQAGVLLFALLDLLSARFSLRVSQRLSSSAVNKGETALLTLEIRNLSILPVSGLVLTLRATETCFGLPSQKRLLRIYPRGRCEVRVPMEAPYCGAYMVGLESGSASDLFGLFRMKLSAKDLKSGGFLSLTALPRVINVSGDEYLYDGDREGDSPGPVTDVEPSPDVRRFLPGDPQKRIHWKLSARSRELFTRAQESSSGFSSWMFVDCPDHGLSGLPAYIYEDAVIETGVACSFWLLSQGKTRLTVNAGSITTLDVDGPEGFGLLFGALSAMNFDGNIPLHRLLTSELNKLNDWPHVAAVVKSVTEDLVALLSSLTENGKRVTLFLAGAAIPGSGQNNLLERLEGSGVVIMSLPRDAGSKEGGL